MQTLKRPAVFSADLHRGKPFSWSRLGPLANQASFRFDFCSKEKQYIKNLDSIVLKNHNFEKNDGKSPV
jgi:hypothetical protein